MKSRLLNIVLLGDRKFPTEVITRLSHEKHVSANNKASRSSWSISLWTSVAKLVARVTVVAKGFEKGIQAVRSRLCFWRVHTTLEADAWAFGYSKHAHNTRHTRIGHVADSESQHMLLAQTAASTAAGSSTQLAGS